MKAVILLDYIFATQSTCLRFANNSILPPRLWLVHCVRGFFHYFETRSSLRSQCGGGLLGRGSRGRNGIHGVIVKVYGTKGRLEPTLVGVVVLVETGAVRDIDRGSE